MKRSLLFAALVAFSSTVFAGAVMPTSTRYTSGVLAGSTPVLNESNLYTFPAAAAGGVPVNVTSNNVYSIGGDPSYISRVGTAALGVGLVAAGLFSAPAVVATLNVVAAGAAGYALWQALKSHGISVDSSGVPQTAGPVTPLHYSSYCLGGVNGTPCGVPSFLVQSYSNGWPAPYSFRYDCSLTTGQCTVWSDNACGGSCALMYPATGSTLIPTGNAPPSPSTNQDLSNAIAAVTADSAVAADTLGYAIAHGLDVKSMLPPATANTGAAPAPVVSPETTVKTQTDAQGNTVRTTEQTSTTVSPPATAGDHASATQVVTTRNYLNGSSSPSTSSVAVSTPAVVVNSGAMTPNNAAAVPSNFPTDYNREVTQQKIVDGLAVAPAAALADTETADMNALTGDSSTIIPHLDRTQLAGTVNFPSSGSCTVLTFNVAGHSFNADPCPMVNYLHPLINYLFVFLFGILNLRLAFKNDEVSS